MKIRLKNGWYSVYHKSRGASKSEERLLAIVKTIVIVSVFPRPDAHIP